MFTPTLDDREIEMIVLALRFWRAQRSGETRRTDVSFVGPDEVDFLLAKLQNPPRRRSIAPRAARLEPLEPLDSDGASR